MTKLRQLISSLSALSHRGFIRPFAALLLGVVLFAIVLHMRHRPSQWRPPDVLVKFADETIALYRSEPTANANDHEALVSAFSSGIIYYNDDYDENGDSISQDVGDRQYLIETQRNSLFETMAQIINLRSRADADEYAQWMRNRGYTLNEVNRTGPHSTHYIRVFRYRTGRDMTPEDTPWDIFKLTFEAELGGKQGRVTHPTGVVSSPDAMEIWVGTLRDTAPDAAYDWYLHIFDAKIKGASQTNPPDLSKVRWSFGQPYAGWAHWSPPVSYGEIIKRDGQVVFAQINCILRTRKHGSIPATFTFYYEPNNYMWHLSKMSYVNTYEMPLGRGPEF